LAAGRSLDDSFHIESHTPLLQQPSWADVPQKALDAIVVPTIRPRSLDTAVGLAKDIGCALVVLCSTYEQAGQARSECKQVVDGMFVTHVPKSVGRRFLPPHISIHPDVGDKPSCHVDIARKRNFGLLLARLCGWQTIMYLDDDIRDLSAGAVSRAAALTTQFQAVSFQIGHYPDNSVVCHAHRLAGGQQDTFPGGSALLIDVTRSNTLFPPVYNEDWLFLFDALQNRSVAIAGTLSQLEYQPFAHSRRAASEEFGDVIAEGLYRLVHEGADALRATDVYWRRVLDQRFQLIDDVAARLMQRAGAPDVGRALVSLAAARKRLTEISAPACVSFIHAWRADLDIWRETLVGLPVVGDLLDAARRLELPAQEGNKTSRTSGTRRLCDQVTTCDQATIDPSAQVAHTAIIGNPFRPLLDGRRLKVDRETVIGARAWIGQYTTVGQGTEIGADAIIEDFVGIQPLANIGPHVLVANRSSIGIGATVGHNSVIKGHLGDYTRIGAACTIAGELIHKVIDPSGGWDDPTSEEPAPVVEDGAFVGWRAVIVGGVNIGARAYICAGALVTKDVPAGYIACGRNQIMHPSAWPGALGKSPFFGPVSGSLPMTALPSLSGSQPTA
jgi:acetyltransferase-like isoleucine patch superfamily enzyme